MRVGDLARPAPWLPLPGRLPSALACSVWASLNLLLGLLAAWRSLRPVVARTLSAAFSTAARAASAWCELLAGDLRQLPGRFAGLLAQLAWRPRPACSAAFCGFAAALFGGGLARLAGLLLGGVELLGRFVRSPACAWASIWAASGAVFFTPSAIFSATSARPSARRPAPRPASVSRPFVLGGFAGFLGDFSLGSGGPFERFGGAGQLADFDRLLPPLAYRPAARRLRPGPA